MGPTVKALVKRKAQSSDVNTAVAQVQEDESRSVPSPEEPTSTRKSGVAPRSTHMPSAPPSKSRFRPAQSMTVMESRVPRRLHA
eukprot:CAMPEP_0171961270 /NCGR_PEP_ID=MMETSP0993-20121228/161203_1 /TAXON_ID=483369 /ORGANISM="non described non described, Strain CCMP2098" /LENGTH=83 /DNA_ID=CAMNT_0012609283 /DNA_START=301 /DNA_END=552 /DNA_ORIENTATION=-